MKNYYFSKTTNEIKVTASPIYIEEKSKPSENIFYWTYEIDIENMSEKEVHLVNRHWVIVAENGSIEEVKGDGVLGKQPYIKPKSVYSYSSFTTLPTPSGMMLGSYGLVNEEGIFMNIEIPTFVLDSPLNKSLKN